MLLRPQKRVRAADHGASITEYAALIVLVGVIAAVIAASSIGGLITDHISHSICTAIGGDDCDSPAEEPVADDEAPSPADEEPPEHTQEHATNADEEAVMYPDMVIPAVDTPAVDGSSGGPPVLCDPICDPDDAPDGDPFDLRPPHHWEDGNAQDSQQNYDSEELPPWVSQRDGGERNRSVRSAAQQLVWGARVLGRDDAADYLQHFLDGSGEPLTVDMDRLWEDVPEFQEEVENEHERIGEEAVVQAQDMDEDGPVTFPINTDWEPWGYRGEEHYGEGAEGYVYDDSNWIHAIGSFTYNLSGEVTVHPPDTEGGDWTYEIDTNVNMQKFYDWTESATEPFFDGPESLVFPYSERDLSNLHEVGLAQEYWLEGSTSHSSEGSG